MQYNATARTGNKFMDALEEALSVRVKIRGLLLPLTTALNPSDLFVGHAEEKSVEFFGRT